MENNNKKQWSLSKLEVEKIQKYADIAVKETAKEYRKILKNYSEYNTNVEADVRNILYYYLRRQLSENKELEDKFLKLSASECKSEKILETGRRGKIDFIVLDRVLWGEDSCRQILAIEIKHRGAKFNEERFMNIIKKDIEKLLGEIDDKYDTKLYYLFVHTRQHDLNVSEQAKQINKIIRSMDITGKIKFYYIHKTGVYLNGVFAF